MIQKLLTRPVRQLSQVDLQMFLLSGLRQSQQPMKADLWMVILIRFNPIRKFPKVQAITALANGLGLTPSQPAILLVPTTQMPRRFHPGLAPVAATQANVVVNYPDVRTLNPQAPLTRAGGNLYYQARSDWDKHNHFPVNVAAANYIVGGPGAVSQTPQLLLKKLFQLRDTLLQLPMFSQVEPPVGFQLGVAANFGLTGDSAGRRH